jgi:hypothetical protein
MAKSTYITTGVRDRIAAVVRRVEGEPIFRQQQQNRQPVIMIPGPYEAIVGTAITAASGTTYGHGTATIQIDDGSLNAIADTSYTSPVTVLNWSTSSGTISTGKHILISWRNSRWTLIWADC